MVSAKLFALASFLAAALASPVASPNPNPLPSPGAKAVEVRGELGKRVQGVHLVNCGDPDVYSMVVFCPNDGSAACNSFPGPGNECVTPPSGGVQFWESSGSCRFDTGVTFSWNIESSAQSKPNFSVVGSGSNGFTSFTIRKDNLHTMFFDGNGNACRSVYYALP
ncbi:hypothetical protein B0T26DRAFT_651067 [Lasiosphaeria miniovina]|uniref:Uncharacterized protein n=1 Tax=Lasiosphaeria miniovina TaxID=1954250 RepID=A0AA40DV58_9PEZI|nr:uncharacterized protein B0T26DRAFT_651067 [Lasiosphaeria miniovina]KAK0712923.1 hypothetical protein B0T26DRAFT_651067 [Lasiosphaeria miniovina]